MTSVTDYRAIAATASDGSAVTLNGTAVGRGAVVTYSFDASSSNDYRSVLSDALLTSFRPFSASDKSTAQAALAAWAAVSGLVFQEVPSGLGEIRFGKYDFSKDPAYADDSGFAFYPNAIYNPSLVYGGQSEVGSDVFIDIASLAGVNSRAASYLMLHEIGHAIGLKHSFEGSYTLPSASDNSNTTVMSYDFVGSTGLGSLDKVAAAYLYGTVDPTNFTYDPIALRFTFAETAGNDVQRGTTVSDIVDGGAGNDQIYGLRGDDTLIGGAGDDVLVGGSGNDVLRPGAGNDKVEGRSGLSNDTASAKDVDTVDYSDTSGAVSINLASTSYDSATGLTYSAKGATIGLDLIRNVQNVITGAGGDTIVGTSGANVIFSGAGNDTISAGAGNDVSTPGPGSDVVDGGAGFDTILYGDSIRTYAMHVTSANHVNTVTVAGNGASDTLRNVELITFAEGVVTFDATTPGGQVYALYDGLLGRAPDVTGLEYWADQFADGVAPKTLAAGFLASAEGQARAGAADNATFVTQLYDATLHRSPDASGLQYWTGQLNAGTSRAEIGVGFALSPEHLANIQPALEAGLFVPDADASAVARVYYTMLSRAPDAAGLKFWTDAIKTGTPLTAETQTFLNLPEAQAKVAGLTTAQYVDLVYTNALGRHAEVNGLAFWTNAIDAHLASRVDVTTQIGQSAEAQAHLAPLIEQGWQIT